MLYWIAFPIIPFLNVPYKAAIIPGMIVLGEGLTLIVIALLGREKDVHGSDSLLHGLAPLLKLLAVVSPYRADAFDGFYVTDVCGEAHLAGHAMCATL